MENIKQILKQKYKINNQLKDTIFYLRSDIEENKKITELNEKLFSVCRIGGMYGYLARYAHQFKLENLELCIDASPPTTIHDLIINELAEEKTLKKQHENNMLLLFKDFRFPVAHLTKQDMNIKAEQQGFLEIMNQAWYCMTPSGEKPCGNCPACTTAKTAQIL